MIREVKTYRDESGREVRAYSPLTGDSKTVFTGKVRVKITPPPSMNQNTQVFERDFEFPMTDDITSVEMAFEKFDEVCKKRVEERKEKVLKKAAKEEPLNSENPA